MEISMVCCSPVVCLEGSVVNDQEMADKVSIILNKAVYKRHTVMQ